MGYFAGKNILIIGGTGTIGHGLINELLRENPKVIRIFSRDEYKQFLMQDEFRGILDRFRFLIGDVRDYDRVERAMNGIDIVFNLAAMKHVPACEYNPGEAIKTNITGMQNVIKAATYYNVECVVFTSSDKAINPTNSYGATKLLAEKLVQAANYSKGNARTKFVAVRFGNVMGSRGSVIPLFKKQIEDNLTITVTDPNMSRFMMTLNQAVRLIMTAAEESIGGEVFILKMPVIKLIDLAKVVIEETSRKLDRSPERIKVKEIGLRAGERCYEELMTQEESVNAYDMGHSYAVIPSSFYMGDYTARYNKYKKAEIGSYNSSNIEPITLDEVRKLLKNCGLI
ncbi:UDP-N-acetylglucosamine 4,6-dehydratase family protein [Clostridium felsineum]|uniref:UDP-N-acetylglucosamine 4,6-dehydratase family protein n=1 Tax=Clostridium felsineum TaxID=36839 RepID=UPI00098C20F4|nr:SDR family NAD(P)-dependent oxidoreductase [Clostridium felsineum]URZ00966.1 UDP-N-acetylglucosamine 4,6-dehydratase (inverting) [Clostridium felsineum]